MSAMHVIDYKIYGGDMQFVEIELDPGEASIAEAGGMMYMDDGVEMETIFGDGTGSSGGFMGALMGAGKRLLTGESLFMTVFVNKGSGKKKVAFGAPYPGTIVPVNLSQVGGELIAQKDSFLCAAKGVSIGIAFQKRLGAGFFGGEGFIMQRLQGDGLCFVHAGGTLHERTLSPSASTPAASWPFNRRSTTTSSSSARSSPRFSAARVSSSRPCAGPARYGFSPSPCRAWPTVSWAPRRSPDAADAKRAPSWARSGACSAATTLDEVKGAGHGPGPLNKPLACARRVLLKFESPE
jgi:uncharacterized protein (AIM24 family)